jgi:hypothetical protein
MRPIVKPNADDPSRAGNNRPPDEIIVGHHRVATRRVAKQLRERSVSTQLGVFAYEHVLAVNQRDDCRT